MYLSTGGGGGRGEGGGVGEFQCVRKFELDTVEGFAQLSVSNLKTFGYDHDH